MGLLQYGQLIKQLMVLFNQKWMAQCERILCLSINNNDGLLIFIIYDKTIKF
ncbi:unnamed protein product [Paramecium pentaurelia]|uniref:Uncharacterized protein n=1 Tax=Paramecium pentaurelia TaxID=43138 RepID=A0A8S1X4Z9_9CILI|nr:unnamed protein product [Paramecium pentaurelia]